MYMYGSVTPRVNAQSREHYKLRQKDAEQSIKGKQIDIQEHQLTGATYCFNCMQNHDIQAKASAKYTNFQVIHIQAKACST